jgi:protocatechuate 3,4-dioxygenase beta subunit
MKDKKDKKRDSKLLLGRREVLAAFGLVSPLVILGCSSSSGSGGGTDGGTGGTAGIGGAGGGGGAASGFGGGGAGGGDGSTADCEEIADETAGPYPDTDGMISNTTYERQDITEGKTGTPLTLTLTLVDTTTSCLPVVGARVIIWHCDANGVYSEYAASMNSGNGEAGSTITTFLRGWQISDSNGQVTYKTIFPGWYTPRVTHIHFMVYNPNNLSSPVKTTQFTFTDSLIQSVYAQTSLYSKGQNSTTVETDMVFGGNADGLIAAVTGSNGTGYVATLPVGIEGY